MHTNNSVLCFLCANKSKANSSLFLSPLSPPPPLSLLKDSKIQYLCLAGISRGPNFNSSCELSVNYWTKRVFFRDSCFVSDLIISFKFKNALFICYTRVNMCSTEVGPRAHKQTHARKCGYLCVCEYIKKKKP